eukprot:CAMPEP_0172658680 /NCGR_PEP_ID=MMETSP1074-20121228/2920_1 /TAXON_ID=2916 /ORGANISM="Ceratium fusus, Strain PA161109" /LENGTH=263 /DNA_ID=CAMNT_0013474005 /DNA_START=102 /DNA_END=893 /DNA_ORIENTATION=+
MVSGATGRTGSLLYKRLKAERSWNVRAFVRNATKAKGILGCNKCDESEGVFVGDITKPETLMKGMKDADVLAITTASVPKCTGLPFIGKCIYPRGGDSKSVDWLGTKAQVKAFALAGGNVTAKHILYVSTMETTVPNNFLDKLGNNSFTSFYHLQAEASIMNSGIPFTIPKACGLGDGEAGQKQLIVGHDDSSFSLVINHLIQRDDVARVLVEAIRNPAMSSGLRFDICSHFLGAPTTDIAKDVFQAAMFPWDSRARSLKLVV